MLNAEDSDESLGLALCVILTGIMTRHPIMLKKMKMLRHILTNRRKIAASRPTVSTSWASRVLITGLSQANRPFPTGGGACLRSACLTFGA